MSLPSWALASLDDAKTHLRVETTDDDALIERLIEAATMTAENYTGRYFVQRTRTETHVGEGREILVLQKRPVIAVQQVELRGEIITDYVVLSAVGRLHRASGWPYAPATITYTAGNLTDRSEAASNVPDVLQWVLERVARQYQRRAEGLRQEQVSDLGSLVWEADDFTALVPYRVPVI